MKIDQVFPGGGAAAGEFEFQLRHPVRLGGDGLASQQALNPILYIASTIRAMPTIQLARSSRPAALRQFPQPIIALVHCAISIVDELRHNFPASAPLLPILTDEGIMKHQNSVDPKKFVSLIRCEIEKVADHGLMSSIDSSTKRFRDRLLALRDPHAQRYITLLPREPCLRMSDCEACDIVHFIHGLHIDNEHSTYCTACHKPNSPDHTMVCPVLRRRGATIRHDLVLRALKRRAEMAGCLFVVEPRVHDVVRKKPDGRITLLGVDANLFTDVSCIHTLAPSYVNVAPATQLRGRDSTKFNKYIALCNASNDDFCAFSLTTFGAFSESAKKLIDRITQHYYDMCSSTVRDFKQSCYNELLVALHRGNALLLRQRQRKAVF